MLYFIGEVTHVAIAPLTNIAMAVRLEPDLGKTLKECFILGGNTEGRIIKQCLISFDPFIPREGPERSD